MSQQAETKKQIKLIAPNSWDDITLKQYVGLIDLGTKYDLKEPDQLLEYRLAQVGILNPDVSRDDLGLMTLPQLTEYFKAIEFLNAEPVLRNCKVIEIDGKKYEFQDLKLMSLEQWIDTEKFTSLDQAHKLIAIFYIKASEYNAGEHDKVSEYLLNAPATEYFWSVSFFLFIHKAFELAILRYSKIQDRAQLIIQKAEKVEKFKRKVLKQFGFK